MLPDKFDQRAIKNCLSYMVTKFISKLTHNNTTQVIAVVCLFSLMIIHILASPLFSKELSDKDNCMLQLITTGPDNMTLAQVRERCSSNKSSFSNLPENESDNTSGLVEKRRASEEKSLVQPFTLMAHKSNYLLFGTYNFQGWDSSGYELRSSQDISFDNTEVQFQLSIKTPVAVDLFNRNIGIFAAYTMRSFWQAYNSDISSPFRETNHQPEIWLQSEHDWELFGIKNSLNVFGLVHQSNGQTAQLSRSWNRVFAGFLFERDSLALYLKPWIRVSESEKSDDNPDITDFLGHGEIYFTYKRQDHVFSVMSRNNLESGFSKGAIELGWSFPLLSYDYIKGYIQYFTGYGESLIDYDNYVNRIGVGILLTDIL